MLLKYAVEECFKVGKRRAFIASIRGFPFHISVKRCGNRAYSCVCHITYHEHLASSEKLRNNAHIVLQLLVGFLRVRHFTGRGFQLNNGDWQSVDEYHYVGTFGGFAICNRPLVGNHKRIVVDIVCVDYLDMVATQWALSGFEGHIQPILQPIGEGYVCTYQRLAELFSDFADGFIHGGDFVRSVYSQHCLTQCSRYGGIGKFPAGICVKFRAIMVFIAHILEQWDYRLFVWIFCEMKRLRHNRLALNYHLSGGSARFYNQ